MNRNNTSLQQQTRSLDGIPVFVEPLVRAPAGAAEARRDRCSTPAACATMVISSVAAGLEGNHFHRSPGNRTPIRPQHRSWHIGPARKAVKGGQLGERSERTLGDTLEDEGQL